MATRFTLTGLAELRAELRRLPDDMKTEAAHLIEAAANGAAASIKAGYPRRTGDLRDHVTVEHRQGQFGATSIVKNTSKHANEFENGTQARHTAIGANRGAMPPGHVFAPEMQRKRRQLNEQFKALVARKGLTVTGG